LDLSALRERFDGGTTVETGDLVSGSELLRQVGPFGGLAGLLGRLEIDEGAEDPGLAAAAVEFALEGLYLNRRLSKEDFGPGRTLYGG
jgi:magnesium chelatase subunit I